LGLDLSDALWPIHK